MQIPKKKKGGSANCMRTRAGSYGNWTWSFWADELGILTLLVVDCKNKAEIPTVLILLITETITKLFFLKKKTSVF